MEGERGVQSKRYLRDLFAPFGTSGGPQDPGSENSDFWESCVIRGVPELPRMAKGSGTTRAVCQSFQGRNDRGTEFRSALGE